jgi:hypothetical protein
MMSPLIRLSNQSAPIESTQSIILILNPRHF